MDEYLISIQHSVVVIGSMNPAIHSPSWYRHNDLITEAEELESFNREGEKDSLILLRDVSRFSASAFDINCQRGRWEVTSNHEKHFDRIEDCAAKIFDQLLPHTPVTAFGSNYHFTYKLKVDDVHKRIAELVMKTGLPLPSESPLSASVKFSDKRTDYTLNAQIFPIPKLENAVRVAFNADFTLPRTEALHFMLGPILNQSRKPIRDECRTVGHAIACYIAE